MEKIKLEGQNILNIGHVQIFVKYPIEKIEKINEKYIILLKIPPCVKLGNEELNNILCYDEKGALCWQISHELPSNIASKEQIPYVAIHVIDGELYATDFWGRKFNVDIENGKFVIFTDSEKTAQQYAFEKKEQFVFLKQISTDEIESIKIIQKPIKEFADSICESTIIEKDDVSEWLASLK